MKHETEDQIKKDIQKMFWSLTKKNPRRAYRYKDLMGYQEGSEFVLDTLGMELINAINNRVNK